jgi:transposase-like protein
MPKKTFTPEQIIQKLREVEVNLSKGLSVQEAVRQIEVTEQTYYRWKKEYGGMRTDQAKRLRELEKENSRLKRLVADKELDIQILKEAIHIESKNS